jgi:ribonuclease P protein component
MRESFRQHQKLLPPTYDLLLVARSTVNQWPFAKLERAFAEACGRIASRLSPREP